MATKTIDDSAFATEVHQSELPVLVDFGTSWCAPCIQLGPVLDEVSSELDGKLKIVKVDVDHNAVYATELGVRGIPALFLFKGGKVVANRVGNSSKSSLKAWIEGAIDAA